MFVAIDWMVVGCGTMKIDGARLESSVPPPAFFDPAASGERRATRGSQALLAMSVVLCVLAGCVLEEDLEGARIEPDCTLEGEFIVELGEARDGFAVILPGEEPTLIHGPQGGTHLVLAARLTTPDPIDSYEVALIAEVASESCVDADCADFFTAGQIALTIEGPERIVQVGPDTIEVPSLFLVVNGWDPTRIRKLTLDVSDACGRATTDLRIF